MGVKGFLYLRVRKENTEGANHTPFVRIPQAAAWLEEGRREGGKLISAQNHSKLSSTEGWIDRPFFSKAGSQQEGMRQESGGLKMFFQLKPQIDLQGGTDRGRLPLSIPLRLGKKKFWVD